MQRLSENHVCLEETAAQVTSYLKNGIENTLDFEMVLKESRNLVKAFSGYRKRVDLDNIDKANLLQRELTAKCAPFFGSLHDLLRTMDREFRRLEKEAKDKDLKAIKTKLEELHRKIREMEYFFGHIHWLHERFPKAKYEDVTGLCKLAMLEEIKEQVTLSIPDGMLGWSSKKTGKPKRNS